MHNQSHMSLRLCLVSTLASTTLQPVYCTGQQGTVTLTVSVTVSDSDEWVSDEWVTLLQSRLKVYLQTNDKFKLSVQGRIQSG